MEAKATPKKHSWKSERRQDRNTPKATTDCASSKESGETNEQAQTPDDSAFASGMERNGAVSEESSANGAPNTDLTEAQKEETQKQQVEAEELGALSAFVKETELRLQQKHELREANTRAAQERPDESSFSRLDSSLKKNTAFVRKLKMLSESQRQSLINEFKGLNLSKYISEVAGALSETKLKMSDIPCFLELSSLLHQRYADFSSQLLEHMQKGLLAKREDKPANPSKYRVDLRLLGDLVAIRVLPPKQGLPLLANQIQLLTQSDMEEHVNLGTVIAFCRYCGDDYAGLLSRRMRLLAEKHGRELPHSDTLPPERQKGCRSLLCNYYTSLTQHLIQAHTEMRALEKQNRRILQTKGELSTERTERTETQRANLAKLQQNTETLADLLDEDLPELPAQDIDNKEEAGLNIFHPDSEFQYDGDMALFEDEDTRVFYEVLLDLKARVPGILYKDSQKEETGEKQAEEEEAAKDDSTLDVDSVERELEEGEDGAKQSRDDDEVPVLEHTEEEEKEAGAQIQLDDFLLSLANCVNRDLIDQAAIDFCMKLNTKANRRRLVKALFNVHRTRYDLLPFYSRFVATLEPCMPDIATELAALLKQDLRFHVKKKDQINIESKIKTARFIGEMTKFNMFPKTEALNCLKQLLGDFMHHNVEMACSLLETCGRFLFRSPESHHRTKVYLEVMMRMKSKRALSQRYIALIENAFYYSNPPDTANAPKPQRPPMHQYIRRLLYKDLSKATVEKIIRQLRKLDWDNEELRQYCVRCMSAVWKVKYSCIHCAANLLAGLAAYQDTVVLEVVDNTIEDIRMGMEVNIPKFNQRRVAAVKFLGEMYNYRLVESGTIFKTLYSFITFGVSLDSKTPSPFDPPDHLFRIRLCCVLLDTCGQFFDRGPAKKKLECFLVYFQRYYWYKRESPIYTEERPFPVDIINQYNDSLELLRPKLQKPESFKEAQEAAEKLEKQLRDKLVAQLPQFKEVFVEESDDGGLAPIHEADEQGSDLDLTQGTQEELQLTEGTPEDSSQFRERTQYESEGEEGLRREEDLSDIDAAASQSDEERTVKLLGGPKLIQCQEDDDFLSAFDKMMSETITARNQEAVKVPQVDIAVPMQFKGRQKERASPPKVLGEQQSHPETKEGVAPKTTNTFNFTLITRKGNKQQYKNLDVPVSSEFASKFKEREEAERLEKERVKLAVLSINERQEEEDYQAEIALGARQGLMPANQNRESRIRYQHPKGAPDADAIFGSNWKR